MLLRKWTVTEVDLHVSSVKVSLLIHRILLKVSGLRVSSTPAEVSLF